MPWLSNADPWLGSQGTVGPSVVVFPPLSSWLGSDGMPDRAFTGPAGAAIATLSLDKYSIEVTGWFVNYLSMPGRWEKLRTENSLPLVIPEEQIRWHDLTRRDLITVRTDIESNEVVGLLNSHENEVDSVFFGIQSRHGRMHTHLLKEELMRQLHLVRNDTFGPSIPGEGRNWLKVVRSSRDEKLLRGRWHTEVAIEVQRRWKPFVVTR